MVRVAGLANASQEALEKVAAGLAAVGPRYRHELPAHLAVPDPGRQGLADAGVGAHEVLVVAQGDHAVQRQHGQRGIAADLIARLRVGGIGGGPRVGHAPHPERARLEQAELIHLNHPLQPDSLAVCRPDVLLPRRRTRAGSAVAELYSGLAFVIPAGHEDVLIRPVSVQRRHLAPQYIIDAHLERRSRPAGRRRTDVRERLLPQGEALVRRAGIAAAEDFLPGLAVRGGRDVRVYDDTTHLVGIR